MQPTRHHDIQSSGNDRDNVPSKFETVVISLIFSTEDTTTVKSGTRCQTMQTQLSETRKSSRAPKPINRLTYEEESTPNKRYPSNDKPRTYYTSEGKYWEVEKVLAARFNEDGKMEAEIKWAGDYHDTSWEPEDNLTVDAYQEACKLCNLPVRESTIPINTCEQTKKRAKKRKGTSKRNPASASAHPFQHGKKRKPTGNEGKDGYYKNTDNGDYWKVKDILDRRVRRIGRKNVIEYLVRWQGDYDDSWQPPENLNEILVAAAFKKFSSANDGEGMDLQTSKQYNSDSTIGTLFKIDGVQYKNLAEKRKAKVKNNKKHMRNLGLLDGEETEDEDEGREGEEGKENEEMEKDDASRSIFSGARTETHNEHDRQQHEQNVWDIIIDHSNGSGDEEDQQDETISYSLYGNKWDEIDKRVPEQEASKDYDSDSENEEYDSEDDQINVLTESTYNARKASPEITVNGRNFRVGDCYDMQDGLKLKIKNLYARQEEAECIQYIPSRDTFVYDTFEFASSSSSSRQIYLRLSTSVTIPVSDLKTRCDAKSFRQSGWIYEHGILSNGGRFRSGALYNNKGRVAASSPGKPKVLELFAGAGGMCLGWRNAGFISKWVVEKDSIFINNLGANFDSAETVLYDCCVRDFLKGCQSNDPNEASAYPKQGEVDHIHASPPCKGYSRANRYGGVNDAENNNLSFEFINAVRHFRPKTATFENVLGMLLNTRKHKNINNLKKILSDLEKMNYQLRWCILDSSDYGDPQERKRITVWAAREDMILPSIPLPTHGVGEGMLRKRTVKDAISSLEVFKPSVGREHRAPIHINGVKVDNHSVPSRIPGPEDFDSGLLEADLPSRTVKCNIHLVHYNEERFISVREAACLQSFPWDYQLIAGDRAKQYEMIGNAMPVMMGTQIARSVGKVYGLP